MPIPYGIDRGAPSEPSPTRRSTAVRGQPLRDLPLPFGGHALVPVIPGRCRDGAAMPHLGWSRAPSSDEHCSQLNQQHLGQRQIPDGR
jgi:hypothetical protein